MEQLIPLCPASSGPKIAESEIHVVLVEGHDGMRRGLRRVLELAPGIRVVAEALDLAGAGAQVRRYHPHVLVLDLRLPDGSSFDFLRATPRRARLGVVATTMDSNVALATEALRAGAEAVVLKDNADLELAPAIEAVARGERFISPRLRGA